MECIFCRIAQKIIKNKDVIFENSDVLVMLDQDWAVKGHTLVIWKEHKKNLSDLTIDEYNAFSEIVHRTEQVLLEELEVERSIILKSGGLVPHFHFHVYPIEDGISWENIKDIFDKKTKYKCSEKEKNDFINKLKIKLNIQITKKR